MDQITVEDITVTVIRKKVKRLTLRILPSSMVTITVPLNTGTDRIAQMIRSHLAWLRQGVAKRAAQPQRLFQNGETIPVWGEQVPIRFMNNSLRRCAKLAQGQVIIASPRLSEFKEREALIKDMYTYEMRQAVDRLWIPCQKTAGVQAKEYRLRFMRTRWGTCNTTLRRIWLNIDLAKYPEMCLRYVLLHELTHLLVKPHNTQFYAYLSRFMPDGYQAELLLKIKRQ
ncbi:DUF45 domain-containing protein [bacterium]|nr:DUF45 domain-containing protein [bacterium]